MRIERLAVLQWIGLLLGATTWTVAHLVGIGVTEAECNAAGSELWHLSNPAWQAPIMVVSAVLIAAAELCAVAVFAQTRGLDFGDGPPVPSEKPDEASRRPCENEPPETETCVPFSPRRVKIWIMPANPETP